MTTINLKNITIDERQTISGETFFIIKDNENNQAYFCFQNKLKEGSQDLRTNRENNKEAEIEYIEHKTQKKGQAKEQTSRYYGAEAIKILMSLKEYTELNQEKQKLWADFN